MNPPRTMVRGEDATTESFAILGIEGAVKCATYGTNATHAAEG